MGAIPVIRGPTASVVAVDMALAIDGLVGEQSDPGAAAALRAVTVATICAAVP